VLAAAGGGGGALGVESGVYAGCDGSLNHSSGSPSFDGNAGGADGAGGYGCSSSGGGGGLYGSGSGSFAGSAALSGDGLGGGSWAVGNTYHYATGGFGGGGGTVSAYAPSSGAGGGGGYSGGGGSCGLLGGQAYGGGGGSYCADGLALCAAGYNAGPGYVTVTSLSAPPRPASSACSVPSGLPKAGAFAAAAWADLTTWWGANVYNAALGAPPALWWIWSTSGTAANARAPRAAQRTHYCRCSSVSQADGRRA
jgi:hypothetical protein